MKAILYKDAAKEWRWTLIAGNGKIIADGSEGYSTRQKAREGLELTRKGLQSGDLAIETTNPPNDEHGTV